VIGARSQLFRAVIVHLDSAAGEAREQGSEDLALYIEGVLIPFIQEEQFHAALEEVE
jgi:hypothetical protein